MPEKTDMPMFPDIIPSKITHSMIYVIERDDIKTEQDWVLRGHLERRLCQYCTAVAQKICRIGFDACNASTFTNTPNLSEPPFRQLFRNLAQFESATKT